jgi:A/G-specific adenine glycosylase
MADDQAAFAASLLAWFANAAADLPWRAKPGQTANPYHVWLSEIMLQQTQVATVIGYFNRFVAAFPTVGALADAPLADVLKLWEGLGYYSRARNLQRAAKLVQSEYSGQLPANAAQLQALPGIGRYTANAIASIAFGEALPVLDGNVVRVLSRLHNLSDDVRQAATQKHLWGLAAQQMQSAEAGANPGNYNQAFMELGREVCKPKKPACPQCPVIAYCLAHKENTQHQRPVKAKKAATPHYDMAVLVLQNELGQLLIGQRPANGLLGGLWEFPAERCQTNESPAQALQRLANRLSVSWANPEPLPIVKHAFTHFKITLHPVACSLRGPAPEAAILAGYEALVWEPLAELSRYAIARADRHIITFLQGQANRLF